ncbi:MAG: inorganic phosphate transporter [Alistipes sp.]|nr:inorganic phosphate transporter [Alistipes sp.]
MSEIYIAVVAVLAILAVSGLYVGVTNDAVNFLNSAIGSKAASLRVILAVASVGIIIGAVTSSGMMEVARNGMFDPSRFTFAEIMMLYVGVMFANVILLDLYNSLGLPTSTTVSLIFCLLGSAMAVATFKIATDDALTLDMLGEYINTSRAMGIISAILLSVLIAFTCGTAIMYVSRLIFSFRYIPMLRRLGAVWCGASLTTIIYFALFKGLRNALAGSAFIEWIDQSLWLALPVCWAGCSLLLFFLQLFRINILRITILAGTFSLALAFAGNDLVNFIGVPVAAFDSYSIARAAGSDTITMGALNEPAPANTIFVLAAGAIMVLTLWTSRKAMHVTETEISLSSQNDDAPEQYSSSLFSRTVVRATLNIVNFFDKVSSPRVKKFVASRFEWADIEHTGAPYDMIRATVNLTTSSLLIALATSLKLPLSTTYVCFMVAMGSSLADRAWGRESAVYRITGVMTVITGWFVTAIGGFLIALAMGLILMWGGMIAFGVITVLCLYMLIRSNFRKPKQKEESEKPVLPTRENLAESVVENVGTTIKNSTRIYNRTLVALMKEDRKALKEAMQEAEQMYEYNNKLKYSVAATIKGTYGADLNLSLYYVQMSDYLNEMSKALVFITKPAFEHIDNNHEGLSRVQTEDLMSINGDVDIIYSRIIYMIANSDFTDIDSVLDMRDEIFDRIADATKDELARITSGESNSKAGMLYLNILSETKTMVLQSRNLLKSQRLFMSQEGRLTHWARRRE